MAFPPLVRYPKNYDDDYTLFLVHDTTETRLSADNAPWAEEIDILPVGADEPEIWASNGFATIEGELLYYDDVVLDDNGKVERLRGCARQLGGERTQFNKRGTWIRSFVVAETHNQMAVGVMKTQKFLGVDFDEDHETLDWRIRNLQALDIIWDDYSCPDINFTWTVVENDPVRGILAEYLIEITPPGSISSFRLDFGDGSFTTTDFEGEHRYALNARIDPVVRVSNDRCQIIQTPIERSDPAEPPAIVEQVFDFPIQEVPEFPDFTFVPCDVPEPDINLPPLITPCFSLEGGFNIPSVIIGPDIILVSHVLIEIEGGITIPSVIEIIGPSVIVIEPFIPPTIIIDPPIPPTIVIIPPPSNIMMDVDFSSMPDFKVDWGAPPEMNVQMTIGRPVLKSQSLSADSEMMSAFGPEFADIFDKSNESTIEYEAVGIPSEIMVIMPDDPSVRLDASELDNKRIMVDASEVKLPSNIKILGPDSPLPDSIIFDARDLVQAIERLENIQPLKIDASELHRPIRIEMDKPIPDVIRVEAIDFPKSIVLEHNLPEKLILEGPKSIPLSVPDGLFIPVKFPDEMPELKVKLEPMELKITMDQILGQNPEGQNLYYVVPYTKPSS